jgi:transposase
MEQTGFLGMDVSKGTCDFVLLDSGKQPLEDGFVLDDCKQGRQVLSQLIDGWFTGGLTHLYCGVESTGGYENNWFRFLCSLAGRHATGGKTLKVARINPKAIKASGEAALLRTRTDYTSAVSIASYLINWPQKVSYSPQDGQPTDAQWLVARQQVGLITMLVKQKTQLTNQLEKLMYQHIGELLVYCRHGIPGWMLTVLARYPGREQMSRAGHRKLASIKGISSDNTARILTKLDHQQPVSSPMSCHTIQATARQILHLQSQIQTEDAYLISQYKDHPEAKLLATIKSVGIASAVRLVVQIEDIGRFETAKKLCAYFGVHPTWKRSGDGLWKMGMSKQGRSSVRATLYMCSLSAIHHNEDLKALYDSFRLKGMNHYQAIGVVMHKLLRIIFGMLKHQTPYDPVIDQKNRETAEHNRSEYEQKTTEADRNKQSHKQRYMSPDSEVTDQAPISRRAYQKRKQLASQSSVKEEYAGSPPAQNQDKIIQLKLEN